MNDRSLRIRKKIIKFACYFAIFFITYIIQTTPRLLSIGGIRPVLFVPFCIAIACNEGGYAGALSGAAVGIMWDLSSARTVGYFAIALMVVCFFAGIAISLFFKHNTFNVTALTFAAQLLVLGIDFTFSYLLFGYRGAGTMFWGTVFPTIVYTSIFAPLYNGLSFKLHTKLSVDGF